VFAAPAEGEPEFHPQRRLMLTLPEAGQTGILWVARFPGCAALDTSELLATLDARELTLDYRQRRERALTTGFAGVALAQGLLLGGLLVSGSAAFDSRTDDDHWVPVGLGIMGAGLVMDYATVHHFLRLARRERHPAAWLDVREAAFYVQRYNDAR
jgi:hypothetical protein